MCVFVVDVVWCWFGLINGGGKCVRFVMIECGYGDVFVSVVGGKFLVMLVLFECSLICY